MPEPVLSLKGAELSLEGNAGRVRILRDISLDVHRGETLGLVGPSGSGKSSLLMLMGGLERATGGRVVALGQDLAAMDEDELARFRRDRMGVVFQSFHLIPTMTALENVATPLELAGRRDAFERAEAELEAVGLGHRAGHYPRQLSGGEQQRVALARASAPHPEIVLADEPTGNLDATNGAAIMDLLFSLRDRHGATLVLVTHAPDLASRCDRVARLHDGRLAGTENPNDGVGANGEAAPSTASVASNATGVNGEVDASEASNTADATGETGATGEPHRIGEASNAREAGSAGSAGQTGQAGQAGQVGQTGQIGISGESGRPERTAAE